MWWAESRQRWPRLTGKREGPGAVRVYTESHRRTTLQEARSMKGEEQIRLATSDPGAQGAPRPAQEGRTQWVVFHGGLVFRGAPSCRPSA